MRPSFTFFAAIAILSSSWSWHVNADAATLVQRETVPVPNTEGPLSTVTAATSDVTNAPLTPTASSATSANVTGSTPRGTPLPQTPVPSLTNDPFPTSTPLGGDGSNSTSLLPLQPRITPGVGIAGTILLLTGVVYTVIGIKNSLIYVFFSSAYLSSLAISVLIVYVMNPPVSDGLQGGFFVAAFVSGLIFGGLSLIFREVTEGLGCLLGGFCLSMWFLMLSPGGLIKSTAGKVIFISVMSLGAFCLSFSRYTRNYSLIVCIAFAGATATILGIDCFSRAGMKEFWLYLWDLNNDRLFPLNTTTYPLTRGITVELAGIIIFTIFGVISQLQIWKMVKERRGKKDEARLRREQSMERLEAELGRNIETTVTRERGQWEKIYGDKASSHPHSDSGFESRSSVNRNSMSIREIPVSSIELQETDVSKGQNAATESTRRRSYTVASLSQEDDGQPTGRAGTPIPKAGRASKRNSITSVREQAATEPLGTADKRDSQQLASPLPSIIPLPFRIPSSVLPRFESTRSVSEAPDSERRVESRSKRRSLLSPHRHSFQSQGEAPTESTEALVQEAEEVEDDRASSIAATLDEIDHRASIYGRSIPSSPEVGSHEDAGLGLTHETKQSSGAASPTTPLTPILTLTMDTGHDISLFHPEDEREALDTGLKSGDSDAPASESGASNLRANLAGHLPRRLSKVAMTYRTNEWAKHLEAAEEPEDGAVQNPGSPGVQVDTQYAEAESQSRSIDHKDQQTKRESLPPMQTDMPQNRTSALNTPVTETAPVVPIDLEALKAEVHRSTSSLSMDRPASALYLQLGRRGSRNVSAPVLAGGQMTSPGGTPPLSRRGSRQALSPALPNTLMSKRDSLIRNRMSGAFYTGSTPALAPPDASSARPLSFRQPDPDDVQQLVDEENMTLAQRRKLMRSQSDLQPQRTRSQGPASHPPPGFDSHQPKRHSTVDREKQQAMLANWRESLRQELTPAPPPPIADDGRRAAMLHLRKAEQQQQALESHRRESMMDSMMRRGDMISLHKEAMRRMQASANEKA